MIRLESRNWQSLLKTPALLSLSVERDLYGYISPWMVETSRCLSAKEIEPSLKCAFLLFCLWQSCSSQVSSVQSYWCHFSNTLRSSGLGVNEQELKVTGWLSRSKVLQGLWFLWMALKEKDGRALISEWSQRWSGAWQWPWPTYAEMWEGGPRTAEGLACLPRHCWELSAGWAFLLFQEDWGNSRGSSRQIPVYLCFVLLSDQMLLTGNLVQNLWVSFPKYLQYYVSLPKLFYTFIVILQQCLK